MRMILRKTPLKVYSNLKCLRDGFRPLALAPELLLLVLEVTEGDKVTMSVSPELAPSDFSWISRWNSNCEAISFRPHACNCSIDAFRAMYFNSGPLMFCSVQKRAKLY